VAAGTYTGTEDPVVTLQPNVAVYGGFAGTEAEIDARDWNQNATVIDGQSARRCVVGSSDAALDGFVIQNGVGINGGGMYNVEASPAVSNCVFMRNRSEGTGEEYGGAVAGGGAVFSSNSSGIFTNCCRVQKRCQERDDEDPPAPRHRFRDDP
jgi:hypothetical protein